MALPSPTGDYLDLPPSERRAVFGSASGSRSRKWRSRKQVSRAVVEHCADGVVRDAVGVLSTSNGMVHGRSKSLESGVYRLRVTGDDTVDPVSDLFTVFDRATR
jgi:hypothetical protein